MLSLNVINPKKKGKITGTIFNLFILENNTSILIDGIDFSEPILFGTRGEIAKHLKSLDKLLFNGTPDTKVVIFTYKWTDGGWKLFGGIRWEGKISEISKKNW